jgi:hypothetical protein
VTEKENTASNEELPLRAEEIRVKATTLDRPSGLGMGEAISLARHRGRSGPTKPWTEHRPRRAQSTAEAEWLIAGFLRAHGRLKDSVAKGDVEPMETFIPLFETLHWVVSARIESELEGHEKKLARAIRFARNRVNHQWAKVLRAQDVPSPGFHTSPSGSRGLHPPLVATWCWRPVDGLPVVRKDPKRRDRKGERLYRKHLAERPALEALDAIAAAIRES